MSDQNAADVIAKLRKRYKIPSNMSLTDLIAFLLLLLEGRRRKRKAAQSKPKPKPHDTSGRISAGSRPIWPPPQNLPPAPPAPPPTNITITTPAQPPALHAPAELPRLPAPSGAAPARLEAPADAATVHPAVLPAEAAPAARHPGPRVVLEDGTELPARPYEISVDEKGNPVVAYGTPEFDIARDEIDRRYDHARRAALEAKADSKRHSEEAAAHAAEAKRKSDEAEAHQEEAKRRAEEAERQRAAALEAQRKIDVARAEAEAKFEKEKPSHVWVQVLKDHPGAKKYHNKSALKTAINNYVVKLHPGDGAAQRAAYTNLYERNAWHEIINLLGPKGELFPPELNDAYKAAMATVEARHKAETDEKFPRMVGSGKRLPIELNNFEIDKVMKRYPGYLGTIAHNQIRSLLRFVKPHGDMGFIINTDNAGQPGTHWQAVFISPDRDRSIEFYDSFGRNPDPKIMPAIHELVRKLRLPYHLKFKVNKIDEQDADSSNCGYYSIKFLVNRFRGESFKKATGFPHDEKDLEQWKKKFPQFKYIDV